MHEIARFLITTGVILGVIGVLLLFHDKIPYIGRLPGDIVIQRKNFTFYFPLVSSIIISIIISILLNIFRR
ncbi:MAG: DUF2905 domain-containing protein [Deltaproteobacteria bacterium]|nr:DUF2905 domain-containing protein [Deltaproteobacteria bacterium]